jgi:hypothetical protein
MYTEDEASLVKDQQQQALTHQAEPMSPPSNARRRRSRRSESSKNRPEPEPEPAPAALAARASEPSAPPAYRLREAASAPKARKR